MERTPEMPRKAGDWLDGWDADPTGFSSSYAGFGDRTSDHAHKDRYTGKTPHPGFRASYLDYHTRNLGHVPGPGMYRTMREFPCFDRGDTHCKGMMNSGRLADSGYMSMSQTAFGKTLNNSLQGRTHLKEGLDVDMKNTISPKSTVPFMTTTPNMRSMKSYSEAKPILLPSSFQTPGPGSYTAFSSFGAASGGTRKRYLGTNKHDNPAGKRVPEKFGEKIINSSLANSSLSPSPKFRVTRSQSTVGL
eukprot:gb/GFBE01072338.1/.p1 GENE.gb/GFBE01072338.1/~~gb/GFBE01072338.1/.p1  ORF type:complete len:247 (+),score=29.12 gb/GFBE01072338.1/:1-741(+)